MMIEELKLENIRNNLLRQEETIIFSMIERAQFLSNDIIYVDKGIPIKNYEKSFMMRLLEETEKIHSQVGRYTSPDEHPFSDKLPRPILKRDYTYPTKKSNVNINKRILDIYVNRIVPLICKKGDDGNYGSSSVCDVNVLQALSKRIHYGKFVAESKFISEQNSYIEIIKEKNREKIIEKLTNSEVENKILHRVKIKANVYGHDPLSKTKECKIQPEIIQYIYREWIIPLTKEVEYLYLVERI